MLKVNEINKLIEETLARLCQPIDREELSDLALEIRRYHDSLKKESPDKLLLLKIDMLDTYVSNMLM